MSNQLKPAMPKRPPAADKRVVVLTLKVNYEESFALLDKAHEYTNGNLSEWLRFAGLNFKPKKKDYA